MEYRFIEYLNELPDGDNKNEMILYFNNQIKFKKQTEHYKDKINVSISLISLIESICKNSDVTIFGSFTRNMIEKIFMNSSENGFGDPINHDIDIIIFNDINDFNKDKKYFYDIITLLKIVAHNPKYSFNETDFYGYKIIDVEEKTIREEDISQSDGFGKRYLLNNPHYNIIMRKEENIIKFDLLGYKVTNNNFLWNNEFNVNSLLFNSNGIFTAVNDKKNSFLHILNSIQKREVICNIDYSSILNNFLTRPRLEKIQIINQIIWFITFRTKILSLGYKNITSNYKFFDYYIEKDEVCDITGNEPPYIKIKLKCNHNISLMALAGIPNIRTSEWSESIKCPFCRTDIELKLIDIPPTDIIIPKLPRKELTHINDYEITNIITSHDNISYISHILNTQSIPINDSDRENISNPIELSRPLINTHRSYQSYIAQVQAFISGRN